MYKLIKSFSDDMYNLMLGLPKCSKGGRCNLDIKGDYFFTTRLWLKECPNRYCSKCRNDVTEYSI